MTEPRDDAPDEALDTETDEELEAETDDDLDGEPAPIEDEDLVDDLVADDEADVDAEVDDYDAARREVAGEESAAVPPPIAPRDRDSRRRAQGPAARTPSPSEVAVHVREDWSRAYVILVVVVFVGILLNGLLLGHGGLLTPIPTPTATPSTSPSSSASSSASPSASATASGSVAPSSAAPSSAAPSASASPSP